MTPHSASKRNEEAAIAQTHMARDIADLREDVTALRADITDLVAAWRNANFALSMVKWIAGAITTISALWFVLTHLGQGK